MPQTFANTIDGNEILAKRSQCDYAGNDIATTYATKGEIPSVPVTDVEVDGVSVVSSGVASITMPTVPSAGNMLSVTNNTLDVTTTAGITDVQQVNALPQNPVSTVLYLIPET